MQQQRDDIASATISEHLINELPKSGITQERLLYSLFTKLRELGEEELLWSWKIALSELKFSELFEVVEIGEVKRGHQADNLLGLSLCLALRVPMEVNLRIGWNGVVYNDIEIIKWNTTSGDVGKNEAGYLFLLNLLDRLAQLDLWHVPNQLKGGNATLL
jgi:hypothetical protein